MSYKNRPLVIIGIIAAVAIVLAMVSNFSSSFPEKLVGGIVQPIEGGGGKIISPVTRFIDNFKTGRVFKENEELKLQINELLAKNKTADEYIKENERLRELLHLKEEIVNQQVVTAEVTALGWDNFSQTVTINRGSSDGVGIDDAVVSPLGVIGRVSEVSSYSSTVTTVLSPYHSLGVRITRTGDLAVCEGDVVLSKDKRLRLDYISGLAELVEGDIVETSGVGGIYPEKLTVGKISEVKKDNSGAVSYAVVEPTADFTRLYEVLVITDWSRAGIAPEYQLEQEEQTAETVDEITDSEAENAEG